MDLKKSTEERIEKIKNKIATITGISTKKIKDEDIIDFAICFLYSALK